MAFESKHSKRRLVALERRKDFLAMRLAGARLAEIAERYGVSVATVSVSLKTALEHERAICAELADEYRALELARLEALRQALWPMALGVRRTKSGRQKQGEPNLDAVLTLVDVRPDEVDVVQVGVASHYYQIHHWIQKDYFRHVEDVA